MKEDLIQLINDLQELITAENQEKVSQTMADFRKQMHLIVDTIYDDEMMVESIKISIKVLSALMLVSEDLQRYVLKIKERISALE